MKFEDIDIMAKTMWGESRNQDTSGQIAVAYVIKNRAEARRWYGNTPKEVCLKDWQFSCWNEGDPNRNKMENLPIVDEVYLKMFALAHLVLEEKIKDNTEGSTHYHTTNIMPKWAQGQTPLVVIGDHKFYNNII